VGSYKGVIKVSKYVTKKCVVGKEYKQDTKIIIKIIGKGCTFTILGADSFKREKDGVRL
jgi:hypothetical protein